MYVRTRVVRSVRCGGARGAVAWCDARGTRHVAHDVARGARVVRVARAVRVVRVVPAAPAVQGVYVCVYCVALYYGVFRGVSAVCLR